MMTLIAIDPGPECSAYVAMQESLVLDHGKIPNCALIRLLEFYDVVAIEMIASYGKPVGAETFDTCVWIGRFIERAPCDAHRIFRRDVKRHLCGTENKVTDAVIRQRLIDLYGPSRQKAIGTKKNKGPLYGIRSDEWQALAVGVTHLKIGGTT